MNLEGKIKIIKSESEYKPNQLYLLETVNDVSGFLLEDEKIYFVIKHRVSKSDSISTRYLSLKTNIFINTIENSPSFNPDYYDLLIFSGGSNALFFESFIDLCKMFTNSPTNLSFTDFFYSLLNLFETPNESSFGNLVGVFGELYLIKLLYEKYNISIANYWHNALGTFDKYDFSFNSFNIETKTTTSEGMRFKIKHSQVFNDKKNYIFVNNICLDNSGLSIADLFDYFKKTKPFSNDLNFMIKLQKEKQKVPSKDFQEKKFSHIKTTIYLNQELETLIGIPYCIDSISYTYDFVDKHDKKMEEIVNEIKGDI